MTQITIKEDHKNMTISLTAKGHAGYANIGKDVVCASISMLTQTFAQIALALREQGAKVIYRERDGAVHIHIGIDDTDEGRELFEGASCSLQTIEVGYRLLAKWYPDYIKITSERASCGEECSVL